MNNNRRRNFRQRPQKNIFRRRSGSLNSNNSNSLNGNSNMNFSRNGSMNNIHNVEKTMLKFQQLAKDAQSNGDHMLAQNYLQRRPLFKKYNELNDKRENSLEKLPSDEKQLIKILLIQMKLNLLQTKNYLVQTILNQFKFYQISKFFSSP